MNQRLYIRDRKMHAAAPGKKPRHVDRREWHIERKVQWFPLPWLAMGESGKLLCIAVKILNLESASVDVHDVLGRHWSFSREEHLPFLSLLARLEAVNNDHLDLAPQDLPTRQPKNRVLHLVIRGDVFTHKRIHVEIPDVHPVTIHLRLSQQSLNSVICVKFLRFVMLRKRIEVVTKKYWNSCVTLQCH